MRKRWSVWRVVRVGAVAYGLVLLVAFVFQRRLIYFPEKLSGEPRLDPGFPAKVVRFKAADGVEVTGLYAAPPDKKSPVLLITHGNAGNIRSWADQVGWYLERGYGGLLLDPRGYGWSEGTPDEEGLIADGEAALEFLEKEGIEASRVVAHGISIGSGIVVPLAARHPLKGLILQAPFPDLPSVAQSLFSFLPCRLLLRDRFDNLSYAKSVRCPVLVIHGTADRTIPYRLGKLLFDGFPEGSKKFATAEGRDHNNLPDWKGYWPAIEGFLGRLG